MIFSGLGLNRLDLLGSIRKSLITLRLLFLITVIPLLVPFASNSLNAQNATSGGLNGVVTDPSGAVIPDANVELLDNAKGLIQTTKTNSSGEYLFSFVAPGNYALTVTRPGFRTISQTLDVPLGPPTTLNVSLAIAGRQDIVTVTDQALRFDAENGDTSFTMGRQQVEQTPNPGNDLTYVAQTAPGAIMNTDTLSGGNFSILGMPGTSNMITLNGMSYTGMANGLNATGATNLILGLNAVQEVTVVSNGYSGRFGTLAGAEVNYVTKSGGDEFHGNALFFWNGSALNANDWLNNATGTKRPFDNANQWAGSVGGPIKKGNAFFFLDTEGLDILVPMTDSVVLPSPQFEEATLANIDSKFGSNSASDAFYRKIFALYNSAPGANGAIPGSFSDPLGCTQQFVGPNGLGTTVPCAMHYETTLGRPTYESQVSGRVDWNIRTRDSIFLSLAFSYGHQATSTDPVSSLFNVNSNQPWLQGQLVETHTLSPSAVNQVVVAGWRISGFFPVDSPSAALAALPTQLAWYDADTFTSVGSSTPGRNGFVIAQYLISDDLVQTWGNHKLGFGAGLLRHNFSNLNAVNDGTLIPFTLDAFFQGGTDPATPSTDTTGLSQSFTSNLSQHFSSYNLGFYAQDEWHARPNLTLTIAFRAEHPSNPVCRERCFARLAGPFESVSHDPNQPYDQAIVDNLKQAYESLNTLLWAPRISFAWQPRGVSHNIVLRGGIGIFYNGLPTNAGGLLSSNPPLVDGFFVTGDNIAPNETTSLFRQAANSNAEFLNAFRTGESLSEIQTQVNGFSPPSLASPDRLLMAPQYQKWSLEAQQNIGSNTSVTIGYFGNHGIHELILNPSANAFGFGSLPTAECTSPPVPPCADPRFGVVTQLTSAGISNYNGMVVSFQHRFTGWGQGILQANYTYGHAFDEVSNGGLYQFTSGDSPHPQDPNNFRGSYGSAEYDARHSFNANYVWDLPVRAALHGHGPESLVNGWQVSGTVFARTGFPYTVFDYAESFELQAGNNLGGPIYAVPVGPLPPPGPCGEGAAIPAPTVLCQTPQELTNGNPNPNALFVQAGCETSFNEGTLPGPSGPCSGPTVSSAQGRNRFRGPGYFDTDFALIKNTKIPGWDKGKLGIGLQFFNLFNHPNFGLPDNGSSDSTFGQISYMDSPPTGILGSGLGGDASPRNIQLKVQLQF